MGEGWWYVCFVLLGVLLVLWELLDRGGGCSVRVGTCFIVCCCWYGWGYHVQATRFFQSSGTLLLGVLFVKASH